MCRTTLFATSLLALAIPAQSAVTIVGSGNIAVTVDPSGSYSVTVPDLAWNFIGRVGAPLNNLQSGSGADALGGYSEISFDFQAGAARHASIRTYMEHPDVLFTVSSARGDSWVGGGLDRQGDSGLAGTVADLQQKGNGGAGLARGRDQQVHLNDSLDDAWSTAGVLDLGRLAADRGVHGQDGMRQVAGTDNRAVNSGRRELAGASRQERDNRTGRGRIEWRVEASILIHRKGLTHAGGTRGEDADSRGHDGHGK